MLRFCATIISGKFLLIINLINISAWKTDGVSCFLYSLVIFSLITSGKCQFSCGKFFLPPENFKSTEKIVKNNSFSFVYHLGGFIFYIYPVIAWLINEFFQFHPILQLWSFPPWNHDRIFLKFLQGPNNNKTIINID